MRIGLALPQYDFSTPDPGPLAFETIVGYARQAEELGLASLWLSDHLTWSVEKYGGGPGEYSAYEPLTTLAALARHTERVRLGTLVLCEALRHAAVAAKALATLDRITGGRLDIGLGAGWYEPDYAAIGMQMPPPGERLARLEEAAAVIEGLLPGGPFTGGGDAHHADGAVNHPPALQNPRPPLFIGGKGDRLLSLVARRADGWNTCWAWTPDAWRERSATLDRACEAQGRDPATVTRSLGLYALTGENTKDLEARYERMRAWAPGGMLDRVPLDEWRTGRLVGTAGEVAEQAAGWEALGVDELIVCAGPLPFSVGYHDDVDALAAALSPHLELARRTR